MNPTEEPRVSVVTPFYNTADYLAECIESVLAQKYTNFEYILVNNKSTDGSREIAERYLKQDSRIRLFDNTEFVPQLENFNGALTRISDDSKYVKMLLADDAAFPDCLTEMVGLAEQEPSVGIVSSYYLWGKDLRGGGFDHRATLLPGREVCRKTILERLQYTGSQTVVLFRADIVRARKPFFTPGRLFGDTDAAMEILQEHDLGYVHQVLTFSRKDNESTLNSILSYHPLLLHFYLTTERYGPAVLTPEEFASARAAIRHDYYAYLGSQLVRMRGKKFWDYHRTGLATIGQDLPWPAIVPEAAAELGRLALNPESTAKRAVGWLANRLK